MAAWDDVEIEEAFVTFTLHYPVYNGVYVSFYDGASQQWSTPTMLASEGQFPDVAFANDGDAYILYETGQERHMQRRDAVGGQWSEAEVMPEDYSRSLGIVGRTACLHISGPWLLRQRGL